MPDSEQPAREQHSVTVLETASPEDGANFMREE